jgi:hypothetical protein
MKHGRVPTMLRNHPWDTNGCLLLGKSSFHVYKVLHGEDTLNKLEPSELLFERSGANIRRAVMRPLAARAHNLKMIRHQLPTTNY